MEQDGKKVALETEMNEEEAGLQSGPNSLATPSFPDTILQRMPGAQHSNYVHRFQNFSNGYGQR